jgi:hypothetical protein
VDGTRETACGLLHEAAAENWLRSVLDEARRGTLPGLVKTGATFADAAAEYLRYIEHDRGRKPSTLRGYRSAIKAHLLPAFGSTPIEAVTTEEIERWLAGFGGTARTRNKLLIQLHGILGRQEDVRTSRERRSRGREVPAASRRRHRRVLTRGGLGACTRRGFRTRRCDLLDGCVHRTADGRAARAPLARRRLCGADDQSAGQLLTSLKTSHRRLQHHALRTSSAAPRWSRSPMSATQAAGAAVNSRSARRLGASHQRLHCERGDTRVVAGGASPRPRRFGASFSAREEPLRAGTQGRWGVLRARVTRSFRPTETDRPSPRRPRAMSQSGTDAGTISARDCHVHPAATLASLVAAVRPARRSEIQRSDLVRGLLQVHLANGLLGDGVEPRASTAVRNDSLDHGPMPNETRDHPHVAMSFLPAIQKTRRPASRNRSTSCGRVRICLSRAMTTRLRVATAGIQSGSRTPSGHSGISLWPACTVSRRAASRPCPVRGRFHQRRSGGDRGRRSRPAPSSGGSRFGGRAVVTTELVAKRLQDGFAS